jgi:hypothetical protein
MRTHSHTPALDEQLKTKLRALASADPLLGASEEAIRADIIFCVAALTGYAPGVDQVTQKEWLVFTAEREELLVDLIVSAKGGDTIAQDVLILVADSLTNQSRPLFSDLQRYLVDVVKRPPRGTPAPHPLMRLRRDHSLWVLLEFAVRSGLKATRNRENFKIESACSIVKAILADRSLHISEATLENVWKRRKQIAHLGGIDSALRGWSHGQIQWSRVGIYPS